VGHAVAGALNWPYLDREIIAQAAAIAHVSEETIEEAERVPSLLTRMMEALGRYPAGFELADTIPGLPAAPPLSSDAYRALIEQVIQHLAEHSDAVIIGHAAGAILRGSAQTINVLVCAPLAQRVRLTAADEGLSRDEAERLVKMRDAERGDFHQRFYQVRWQDPAVYDLVVNTGRLSVSAAAAMIVDLVRARLDD
jgi:hypothetical protein